MTAIPLLVAGLEGRGIILSLADGQLRYRAPEGALTADDRAAIAAQRDALLDFLAARDAGRALRQVRPSSGPLVPSVGQQMYYQFGGGPLQGNPVSLNIAMISTLRGVRARDVADAIAALVARHATLRTRIVRHGGRDGADLELTLNDPDGLEIPIVDASGGDDADAVADAVTAEVVGNHIPMESPWLFRAKVATLPGGDVLAAMAANHFISDAGTRNILFQELQDMLDTRAGIHVPARAPSIAFDDFSWGERRFLESGQGALLIDYWRRWYERQPVLRAPSGTALVWGEGTRIVNNFTVPGTVLEQVRILAAEHDATPFLVCLGIFCLAMARWSGSDAFPVRILGDKRSRLDLADTVGLMFCADPVGISVPKGLGFWDMLPGLLAAYEAAIALRLPTLHYFAPHFVRPGIEAFGFPNRIPAVFNYYSGGTARERARRAPLSGAAHAPWPPPMTRLAPQRWSRRSAPLFLHLMDVGTHMSASLHFLADVISQAEEEAFIATFLQVFDDVLRGH